jgi:pimeloyl-ACP methyl ester carboxylesterase
MLTNTLQIPARAEHRGRRVLGKITRGLGLLGGGLALLALTGAGYEALAAQGDAQAYPPPGRLVDVGGYRLHIQCVGTGSPTVVLEAGLGGMSLHWDLVQSAIGQTTRVCAYDRAGMGWSDPGPQPRTPGQIARELHTLLVNAAVPGPYVLVGHSVGGKNVRRFAQQYPAEVAGMVLVDARSEYVEAPPAAVAPPIPPVTGSEWSLYGVARRLGLVRLIGAGQSGPPAMAEHTRTALALLTTGQRGLDATAAESLAMTADNAALQAAPSLGDRPLIVLAAEQSIQMDPAWADGQRRQAALSTQGRLIIAVGSSHHIQVDQPALVIDAVRQVVLQVRGK